MRRFPAARFSELLEEVERTGALGLQQGSVDGSDAFFTMDLVAGHLKDGLAGEGVDSTAVTGDEDLRRGPAGGVAMTRFAAGEDEGGGHAFDVPFPGAGDGFVEIVEVEDQLAVGSGEGAKVLDVGIAAELDDETGVGEAGKVGSHDGDGAAEEGEGGDHHARVFDGEEVLDPVFGGTEEYGDGVESAVFRVEVDMGLAGDGITEALAFGDALGDGERRGGIDGRHEVIVGRQCVTREARGMTTRAAHDNLASLSHYCLPYR